MRALFFSIELIFQSVLDITFVSKQKIPIPQNTEKEATLKQMEQQIQYQDMIENSSHKTPFNNGNKFPMGEAPILIAKITINISAVPVCFDFRR
jgi:hypothetical protein